MERDGVRGRSRSETREERARGGVYKEARGGGESEHREVRWDGVDWGLVCADYLCSYVGYGYFRLIFPIFILPFYSSLQSLTLRRPAGSGSSTVTLNMSLNKNRSIRI